MISKDDPAGHGRLTISSRAARLAAEVSIAKRSFIIDSPHPDSRRGKDYARSEFPYSAGPFCSRRGTLRTRYLPHLDCLELRS
jgi:hypothetical protein